MLLALLRMGKRHSIRGLLFPSAQQAERLLILARTPFTHLQPAEHSRRIRVVLLIIWWLLLVVVVVRVTLVEAVREVFVQPHRLLSSYHRIL
jgi:hypothetical protein